MPLPEVKLKTGSKYRLRRLGNDNDNNSSSNSSNNNNNNRDDEDDEDDRRADRGRVLDVNWNGFAYKSTVPGLL